MKTLCKWPGICRKQAFYEYKAAVLAKHKNIPARFDDNVMARFIKASG